MECGQGSVSTNQ